LPEWYIDIKDFNNMMHYAKDNPTLRDVLIQLKTIWELTKPS